MIYENGCGIKSLYIGLRCNDLTNDACDVFRHKLLEGSFFDSFMNRDDWAERFRMTTDVWNADLVEMRAKLRDTGAAWVRIIPMFAEYYNINIVVRFAGQHCGDQSEHTYSCAPFYGNTIVMLSSSCDFDKRIVMLSSMWETTFPRSSHAGLGRDFTNMFHTREYVSFVKCPTQSGVATSRKCCFPHGLSSI